MLVCGVDIETTGLVAGEDETIEIGAVLWDTVHHKPVGMYSQLVKPRRKDVSLTITELTGITNAEVQKHGIDFVKAIFSLNDILHEAECVIAHNGTMFDKPFLEADCLKEGVSLRERHWLDTSVDIPYPDNIKTRKLVHLAAEHGFLNPFAHRAVFDVLTMLRVVSKYDFQEVLALSKEPTITVEAICAKPWDDGGKSTGEAKANGFYWEGKTKRWLKSLKRNRLQKEIERATTYKVAETEACLT